MSILCSELTCESIGSSDKSDGGDGSKTGHIRFSVFLSKFAKAVDDCDVY